MGLAVRLDRFGDVGALTLQPVAARPLAPTELRIRVTAAGLNPVDWQIVESGALAAAFGIELPAGFGNDFAGTVTEIGPAVTRWRAGDRVFGGARGAAVATSLVLDEAHRSLHRTPDAVSDLTAGALDIAARTAASVLAALAVTPGETVLVGAAGGGVGSLLTQLLAIGGAQVIGTGSAASAAYIRSLGALPVRYGSGLAAELRALGTPVAAAADLYGAETAETALSLGVPARRIVTIEAETPPAGVLAVNGSDADPQALDRLLTLIAEQQLRLPIAAVYSLAQFAQAIAHQRGRHVRSKIVIAPHG